MWKHRLWNPSRDFLFLTSLSQDPFVGSNTFRVGVNWNNWILNFLPQNLQLILLPTDYIEMTCNWAALHFCKQMSIYVLCAHEQLWAYEQVLRAVMSRCSSADRTNLYPICNWKFNKISLILSNLFLYTTQSIRCRTVSDRMSKWAGAHEQLWAYEQVFRADMSKTYFKQESPGHANPSEKVLLCNLSKPTATH